MWKVTITLVAGFALLPTVISARAEEPLRIGFVTTLSGNSAILGEEMKRGWDLGVEALAGKIGGLPTEITVVDDQAKPDVAVTQVDKLINEKRVDVVAGVVWSNVMVAIHDQIIKSGTILFSTNAAAVGAGKDCSPLYITSSWQSDQFPAATAVLAHADGAKDIFIIAANYQSGRDNAAVLEREFKGTVVGTTLFKFGQTDYEAELSEIREKHPSSVVAFAPGGMGIAFLKQWQSLGMSKSIHLYTINMIDETTLPALGGSVIGTSFASVYDETLDTPANRKFLAAFQAKYNRRPSQYAAQAYDGVMLLDAGVRGLGGKVSDHKALVAEIRKANFQSVRGPYRYNNNNFPIQNMYKIEVVAGKDGAPELAGKGTIIKDMQDAYHQDCPMNW